MTAISLSLLARSSTTTSEYGAHLLLQTMVRIYYWRVCCASSLNCITKVYPGLTLQSQCCRLHR
jgi:hypothetical protein